MREFFREHPPLIGFGAAILVALSVFLGMDLLSVAVDYNATLPPRPLTEAASPAPKGVTEEKAVESMQVLMRRDARPAVAKPSPGSQDPEAGLTDEEFDRMLAGGPSSEAGPAPGLRLQGVMVGGGVGIAVFEVNGSSRPVALGETVEGYTLESVETDRVVLRKDGRAVSLGMNRDMGVTVDGEGPPVLPDPDLVPPPPAPAPAGAAAPLPAPPTLLDHAPEPAPAPAEPAASGLTRAEMNAFLDQGAALAREVRASVQRRPNGPSGVKLRFATPGNAMSRLGLQDGDVVISMNGEPIRSPQELYNSYLILRNTDVVEFEVERGGKPTTVRYEFKE